MDIKAYLRAGDYWEVLSYNMRIKQLFVSPQEKYKDGPEFLPSSNFEFSFNICTGIFWDRIVIFPAYFLGFYGINTMFQKFRNYKMGK